MSVAFVDTSRFIVPFLKMEQSKAKQSHF